jgi:type II secretory pathway pseudopilin PulG
MYRGLLRKRTRTARSFGLRRRPGVWNSAQGSTVVELGVVVAIIMIVTAMAVPSLMNTLASAKVRAGMSDLSGVMQNARMLAVKQNRIKVLQFSVKDSRVLAYVDDAAAPTGPSPSLPTPTPPQLEMPREFTRADAPGGGCPELTGTIMWGGGANPLSGVDNAYFNALGAPCKYSAPSCTTVTGFVYYFSYIQGGVTKWAALGISPAGRSKSWYCSGGAWGN